MRALPVTWQIWRSHHSIRSIRKSHAVGPRKLCGFIFYGTEVIADWIFWATLFHKQVIEKKEKNKIKQLYNTTQSFCIAGIGNFAPFAAVTSTLTRWPSYTSLTRIPWRYPRRSKMNFPLHADIETDKHTGRCRRKHCHAASRMVIIIHTFLWRYVCVCVLWSWALAYISSLILFRPMCLLCVCVCFYVFVLFTALYV